MPKQPRTSKNISINSVNEEDIEDTVVNYASGFKPPNTLQMRKAIGFAKSVPIEFEFDKEITKTEFFRPVPKPSHIDDWLAQYNEEGQTYGQFMQECPWLSTRKRKYMSQTFLPTGQTLPKKYPDGKIYIVPVGDFDQENCSFYESLLEYTKIFLGLPVVSLSKIKLQIDNGELYWVNETEHMEDLGRRASQRVKRHRLNSRFNSSTGRLQMRVDSNLIQLRSMIPSDAICMIGLTMLDLYGDDSDLFVAGMAAGSERVAIFSLYRYDPRLTFSAQYWYEIGESDTSNGDDYQCVILQRSCKLLVHEIGHLLGIDHCIFFDCCMNGSGHLLEDFRQPMHLCPVDLHKLQTLIGFDILERYKSLLRFYEGVGFIEEEKWVRERINFLEAASCNF